MGGRSRLDSTLLLGARIPGVKFLKDLSIHKHIDWLGRTTRRDPIAPEKRQFHKFFELPREIRDEIYAYYFSGDIGLSSGLQPHSQYAAGILLANHQLYDEARPIMFKAAAFTINLAPKYARNPKRDYAYHCDHRIGRGSFFTGSQEVFVLFNRIDLVLNSPRSGNQSTHWQRAGTILLLTMNNLPHRHEYVHIRVNVGNLDPICKSTIKLAAQAPSIGMAMTGGESWKCNSTMTSPDDDEGVTDEQMLARGLGRNMRATRTAKEMERMCRLVVMNNLGICARECDAEIRLESHDHKRSRVMTEDTLVQLLQLAEGLDDGKEIWVIVEK